MPRKPSVARSLRAAGPRTHRFSTETPGQTGVAGIPEEVTAPDARSQLPLRYLTPFAFLALLALGVRLGGAWTFLAAVISPLSLLAFDWTLGEETPRPPTSLDERLRWLPRIYLLLQLAVTALAADHAAAPSTGMLAVAGLVLSTGILTGVFGFLAAHEMIHSRVRWERGLGLLFLASVLYMHFRISHIYGHHRRAATEDDPASARPGEGLYTFLTRSIIGQLREAWTFEARRRRRGTAGAGAGNRMITYIFIEVSLVLAIAVVSGRALLFLFCVAVVAVGLLETFNYVAHYGLVRRKGENGRIEPLAPHHSWNSGRRMNNAALFNMGRHSDHHRHSARSYDQLQPVGQSAELPSGYAAAIVIALIPSIWRRTMDPRVAIARRDERVG
jgi:alkane 1-monooxygenase